MGEWQAQEVVGFEFDTQGRGQGTAAARDARDAWVAEYSVGIFFKRKKSKKLKI